jgi:nitrogen regulatory protein P-II 1
MYVLKANVPAASVTDLTDALLRLGVSRIRLAEVCGYTDGIEQERIYRGNRYIVHLLSEVELEALIPNEVVDEAVDTVLSTIRRLQPADGFISVTPLEQCYRISTGNPQI